MVAVQETSAGGVVFRCGGSAEAAQFVLIHDRHGNWGFPKGHVEAGEDAAQAARREVREEVGLEEVVLHGPLGTIDWRFRTRDRQIHKHCHFFLFESSRETPAPQHDEGIRDCGWFSGDAALARLTHDNVRSILREARERVRVLCQRRSPGD